MDIVLTGASAKSRLRRLIGGSFAEAIRQSGLVPAVAQLVQPAPAAAYQAR